MFFLSIDYNTYTKSGLFAIIISGSNVTFENESVHSEKAEILTLTKK